MKVYIASDHAGFQLKEHLKQHLQKRELDVIDCGPEKFNDGDDYPDFISKVAKNVSSDPASMGVVLGYSGAGECIVANKFKNIRSFLAFNEENVLLARKHNNANIISFGSHFTSQQDAIKLTSLFLNTPFSKEERHKRRLDKITKIENEL